MSELLPATDYYFRVIAVNSVGTGKPSAVLKATTACNSPDTPAPPRVVATTPTSITIQWANPRAHGAEISSYSVQVDGAATRLQADAVGAGLSYTIAGLEPKQKYKIKIQATNSVGDSHYSKHTTATTAAIAPLQPRLELVSASHKALTVKWRFPKDVVAVSSVVELRNWWGGFDVVYAGTMTTVKVPKLAPNKVYTLRACGVNSAGKGMFGAPGIFSTLIEPLQMMDSPWVQPLEGHAGCQVVEWDALPKGGGKKVEVQVRQTGKIAAVAAGGAAGAAGEAPARSAHGKAGEGGDDEGIEAIDYDDLSFEDEDVEDVKVGVVYVSLGLCRPFENRLVVRGLHPGTTYAYRVRMVQLEDRVLQGPFSPPQEAPAEWVAAGGSSTHPTATKKPKPTAQKVEKEIAVFDGGDGDE